LTKLDGESFEKVYEGYSAGRQALKVDGTATEIYTLYLHEQKEVRGNSDYQVRDLKRWVGKFTQDFPGRIIPITPEQIKGWLGKRGKKARSKNNARNHIRAFFNFAQKNDYLPQGSLMLRRRLRPSRTRGRSFPPNRKHGRVLRESISIHRRKCVDCWLPLLSLVSSIFLI